jgi:hypothetical protein
MLKLFADFKCECQPLNSRVLNVLIHNDCDGSISRVSGRGLKCVAANRVRFGKQICDIVVAVLVRSSRILSIYCCLPLIRRVVIEFTTV